MIANFSHLQMLEYTVQIGNDITPKVAIFNCNKLPTGVAIKCVETDTFNPYLLTMSKTQFEALFLDDQPIAAESESADENSIEDGGKQYDAYFKD